MRNTFSNKDVTACAIRKTALRANCGGRRCFAHLRALGSSGMIHKDTEIGTLYL